MRRRLKGHPSAGIRMPCYGSWIVVGQGRHQEVQRFDGSIDMRSYSRSVGMRTGGEGYSWTLCWLERWVDHISRAEIHEDEASYWHHLIE